MNTFNRMIIICCLSFCSFLSAMDINQQLIEAAKDGNAEQVQTLLAAGASVDAKVPFHCAACYGREAVRFLSKLLFNRNTSYYVLEDMFDFTPLHWATYYGYKAVVSLLLENNASVDAKDNFGNTPLRYAVGRGQEIIARILLAHNASVDEIDNNGFTPLQLAAEFGHEAIAKLLRWHIYQQLLSESREKNLAFCCAQHPRIGENSPAQLPKELFQYICSLAKPTIEEVDEATSQQSSRSWCNIQ